MECRSAVLRIDQINVPSEHPRTSYAPAAYRQLVASIDRNGVLVPLLVRLLGRGEYALVDGGTRLRALRDLGKPGNTRVPVVVLKGDDAEAIVAAVVVNQVRERLSKAGELRAYRDLTRAQKLEAREAAARLGKSKAWASKMNAVLELPAEVVRQVERAELEFSHAAVIGTEGRDDPALRAFLLREALTGQSSTRALRRLAENHRASGARAARALRPRTVKLGERSWARVEPIRNGVRAELHVEGDDKPADICRKLGDLLGSLRA